MSEEDSKPEAPRAIEKDTSAPRLSEPEDALTPLHRALLEGVREARASARGLRPDQMAFSSLAERLLLGDAVREPLACCRVLTPAEIPGGALSAFQAQSLADFCELGTPPLPTHEAVRRHCKAQLSRLQGAARDPEAARLHTESLSARPHANDAEGMALAAQKDGGHPLGGAPTRPPPQWPPRLGAAGEQLPMVDVAAPCKPPAEAGEGCGECKRGMPCWINTAARIISNADLLSEEGFSSAELQRWPRVVPAEVNEPIIAKVEKLLAQHTVHSAGPQDIDNYSTIFLPATGRSAAL